MGGGITGLAAAFELAQRRVPFVVLEGSGRAGGLILTDRTDGFTIEAGPDSMLVTKPSGIELCKELGLGAQLISTLRPRTAYVAARGRLHRLPVPSVLGIPTTWSAIAGYDLLSPPARVRLALEPVVPRAPDRTDESVGSFFRRRFGAATVDSIAQPLLGGIHAGDVEALSIRSLFPRLAEAEADGRGVLSALRRRGAHAGEDGAFRSLAGGMGELVRAIERRLPDLSVRLNSAVSSLTRERERWRVSWDGGSTSGSAVILTAPAYVVARLVARIDREASDLCAQVPYVSTASVALAWSRADVTHPLRGSGFVVARRHSRLRITACTWVSSKWEGRAPPDAVLIRAFIGGATDPDAASLPEETLLDIARRDVSSVLGILHPPAFARVYRWLRAGAQHNVGQLARTARLETRLAAIPGLFVAGSGFRSIGIPDCVADGRAAAIRAAAYVHATN